MINYNCYMGAGPNHPTVSCYYACFESIQWKQFNGRQYTKYNHHYNNIIIIIIHNLTHKNNYYDIKIRTPRTETRVE